MKMIRFCFLMGIFIILFSCKSDINKTTEDTMLPEMKIVFFDTIFIENQEDLIYLIERQNSSILGYSGNSKEVFVFDDSGRIESRFQRVGEGPEEYNDIWAIGFTNDSDIIIMDEYKILIYSVKGVFKKSCDLDIRSVHPSLWYYNFKKLEDNRFLFNSIKPGLNTEDMPFFDKTHISTLYNLDSCTFQNLGGYDPDGLYRKHVVGINEWPLLLYHEGLQYTVFPLEKKMYLYNVSNLHLVNTFTLFPEETFGEYKYVSGTDPQVQLIQNQANSFYKDFDKSAKELYLLYVSKKPDNEIKDNVFDDNGREEIFFKRDVYLELYDFKGKKLCKDIFVSDYMTQILSVESTDKIIFVKTLKPKNEKEPERLALLYAKLAPK